MLCVYYTCCGTNTSDLWVMKHYDVKESWTKVLLIMPTVQYCATLPRYNFANGEVLLSCESSDVTVFIASKGPFISWNDLVRNNIVHVYV